MSILKIVLVVLEALFALNLLIFVHELGHFLAARWRGMKVERFAINGDHVFINWIFEIRQKDGSFRLLDEVAMQEWSGDRILKEQFYYDPAQIR